LIVTNEDQLTGIIVLFFSDIKVPDYIGFITPYWDELQVFRDELQIFIG